MAPGAGELLVDLAGTADDVDAVMGAVSRTLRRSVGAGPIFLAPADPITTAFSGTYLFDISLPAALAFAEIESRGRDVVSFSSLARGEKVQAASLYAATRGRPQVSERWREVITALRWGDELRAVVRVHGHIWGYLCLHREVGERPFSDRDVARVVDLLPAIGGAMRRVTSLAGSRPVPSATGVVIVDRRGRVTATTGEGDRWLEEIGPADRGELPITVASVVRLALRRGASVASTVLTASGRAAHLEAAPLSGHGAVAVAISAPPPGLALARFAALVGLTPRETEVVELVVEGLSTKSIAEVLSISVHTVQAHLTAVFGKAGVRSRRALVNQVRP